MGMLAGAFSRQCDPLGAPLPALEPCTAPYARVHTHKSQYSNVSFLHAHSVGFSTPECCPSVAHGLSDICLMFLLYCCADHQVEPWASDPHQLQQSDTGAAALHDLL